jgi:hypothetical protein
MSNLSFSTVDFNLNAIIQYGALGLLAFIIVHLLKTALPQMLDSFKEELQQQREVHVEQDKRREEAFTKTLEGQRKDFREEVALLRVTMEKVTERKHNT